MKKPSNSTLNKGRKGIHMFHGPAVTSVHKYAVVNLECQAKC